MLLPKIKKIPKNTNGRLAIPALAGLLVTIAVNLYIVCRLQRINDDDDDDDDDVIHNWCISTFRNDANTVAGNDL